MTAAGLAAWTRPPPARQELRLSVVMPARDEGDRIAGVLDLLLASVRLPCEVLVVVDDPADRTAAVVDRYAAVEPNIRCLVNADGPGAARAIWFGIQRATAPVIVVAMADGSDDLAQIDDLALLVERGAAVAAASRHSPGGHQLGGPLLKKLLSRAAGRARRVLGRAGPGGAPASFKAYSAEFARAAQVQSRQGFAVGIELTAKARRLRLPVAEIPTTWQDRRAGRSSFRLARWLPGYLRWYVYCFGPRLTVGQLASGRAGRAARVGRAEPPGDVG